MTKHAGPGSSRAAVAAAHLSSDDPTRAPESAAADKMSLYWTQVIVSRGMTWK